MVHVSVHVEFINIAIIYFENRIENKLSVHAMLSLLL